MVESFDVSRGKGKWQSEGLAQLRPAHACASSTVGVSHSIYSKMVVCILWEPVDTNEILVG